MDFASKIKLANVGIKTRDINEYSDGEVRQAKKEVADFLKFTGVNLQQAMATPGGKKEIFDMVWERLEKNRETPEERKAKIEAQRKAGKERAAVEKAAKEKARAERKAEEDAKPESVKKMEVKKKRLEDGIAIAKESMEDLYEEYRDENHPLFKYKYAELEARLEKYKKELSELE